ncbi:hypothetical protein [Acuticoccus sp.]|uniref:hypothetical protein n=1 Tax=Acuticoccus sp. TaxID=1904378 RepID=UPI003B5187AD
MNRRHFLTAGAAVLAMPILPAGANGPVRMRDLYEKDLSFSQFALVSEGERIAVRGFMAPPLKAEAPFFVLTKRPMSVCPFCETSAEWPDDILAIYTKRTVDVVPFNVPILTRGELQLGDHRDPNTGFLSRVRLADAVYERA